MNWQKTISIEDLNSKNSHVFKQGSKQIALMQTGNKVFACDNRCPHEGYPLSQGTTDGKCFLTCNWHNWKFNLENGDCVVGGDNLRVYETKIEDDFLWVNLTEPSKEEIAQSVLKGLKQAFEDKDTGRITRELARLHFNEIPMTIGLKKAIEWSFDKYEYGTTHAYAASADWLSLSLENEDNLENQIICLTEAIDHISFDSLRHKTYAFTEKTQKFDYEKFVEAVEEENENEAISMVLGGLESGMHFKDFEKVLTETALKHYNDFGHSLIYVYKIGTLIELLGEEVEKPLLLSLVRSICYATREDLIPEFSYFAECVGKCNFSGEKSLVPLNPDEVFKKNVNNAMDWVVAKSSNSSEEQIFDALLETNANSMLKFDTYYQFAYDKPVGDNISWLGFTHSLTFSNAVRVQCEKFPEFWKFGLLQMACFSGRNVRYLDLEVSEKEWKIENSEEFFTKSFDQILDHGNGLPIFSAHLIKTAFAVREELELATESGKKFLLASLNRFLNSPLKQKHIRRTVRQGVNLVAKDF